jgi:hypothetical protein
MKGFKNLIISTSVGSVAIIGVILYLQMHRPEKPAPVEVIHTTPNELNVDVGTAYLECSHYGKEWQLCTSPEGWGTWPYCPAYSEFNESDLLLIEEGKIGVPTPFSPCFTCPENGISCDDHVEQVFTAAGISEDQNATLGGYNLWDDGKKYCKWMCEVKNEGESCSEDWDNQCKVGYICPLR